MENAETAGWPDFSLACRYTDSTIQQGMIEKSEETGRLLNHMINNPGK